MEVKYCRRILVLGRREAGALDLVKDLTGSTPEPNDSGSIAGLTHEWNVQTAYYSARVPVWLDEISDLDNWTAEFLKPEAKEVVEAVGAWIFCFRQDSQSGIPGEVESAMKAIQQVAEQHANYGADVVKLAVAMPAGKYNGVRDASSEDRDDTCMEYGFEYIEHGATGSNQYGEKVGVERLKEALEANEWATAEDDEEIDLDDLDFDVDDDVSGFEREEAEMTAELFGMKAALDGEDGFDPTLEELPSTGQQAAQVDNLGLIMSKLLAIKEQGADLPQEQRKRLAAQAVRDLMGEDHDDV